MKFSIKNKKFVRLFVLGLLVLGSSVHAQQEQPMIVFTSGRDGNQEIYVMNADGSNQINLTNHPANDWNPSWSPDGTQIVFTSDRDGNTEIYVMNVDGSDVQRLTENTASDDHAQWRPQIPGAPLVNIQPTPVSHENPVSAGFGVVPDLTGLGVPQAAALLNRNGLLLGDQSNQLWTALSPAPPNTIGAQSISAGEQAGIGTSIDITLLQTANALLVWDDNDITLVNNTGLPLDLTTIRFSSIDGSTAASYAASTWSNDMRANRCAQLWSEFRSTPKAIDECGLIQYNRSTTNPAEHFWTGTNGATQFNVAQNGEQRAVCTIAERRCEFYLEGIGGGTNSANTAYIYLAYTTDRLIIKNTSPDQWMPLAETVIYNTLISAEGAPIRVGDPSLYGGQQIIGRVDRLAPNQCIFFTNGAPLRENPPEDCDVLVRVDLNPQTAFWNAAFDINSTTDNQRRTCPVPKPDNLTLCILPR